MPKKIQSISARNIRAMIVFIICFGLVSGRSSGQAGLAVEGQADRLSQTIDFAGETVPLDRWEVKESLDREMDVNINNPANTLQILKLSERIFPTIERILAAQGVPDDFKYLCAAESSLENPISRAGAVGYWQFMEATAKSYQLEINREVDERYHLEKSTLAACAYLKAAYRKFGTWTAAAAAYNCGMGAFNKASAFQGSPNYYDLLLPEETNRYVFRILALKTILEHPERYGYQISRKEKYPAIKTRSIVAHESIENLSTFAKRQGTTYKMLRLLNPWLRAKSLTISRGNQYTIILPEG